jgi:D-sedoheptulose 7-phosphate isomerase
MFIGAQLGPNDYLKKLGYDLSNIDISKMECLSDQIYKCWQCKQRVFIIGNGGSATTASHMAEDLAKSTTPSHQYYTDRLQAISLTDNVGWITAIANDLDYDYIFSEQLATLAIGGDLLIAISGSGNSQNIIEAVTYANNCNINTFGLTGFDGGKLKEIQKDGLHVPVDDMGMVESIHLCIFHWVLDDIYGRINMTGRYAKN